MGQFNNVEVVLTLWPPFPFTKQTSIGTYNR